MKVSVKLIEDINQEEVIIKCVQADHEVEEMVDYIENKHRVVTIVASQKIARVNLKEILYVESVDNNTYFYLRDIVHTGEMKLYEFEEKYSKMNFVRVSKSVIINLSALKSVRKTMNGRLLAKFKNDEEVVINRHYVKMFKERFGV